MILNNIYNLINENKEEYKIPKSKSKGYYTTSISPSERTFKNLPRYSGTKKPIVRFQDWLLIKGEKRTKISNSNSFGKSAADGKWYGWSHRAIAGFFPGKEINSDSSHADEYKKDKVPFTIKTDEEARESAIKFAKSVS